MIWEILIIFTNNFIKIKFKNINFFKQIISISNVFFIYIKMQTSKNKVIQTSDHTIDESKRQNENKQKKEEEAKRKVEEYKQVSERAQKQRDQAEEGNNYFYKNNYF